MGVWHADGEVVESLGGSRALIPAHDRKGRPFRTPDLERWVRLARRRYGCAKADLYVRDAEAAQALVKQCPALLKTAELNGVRLSLRGGPAALAPVADSGLRPRLLDLCLEISEADELSAGGWLSASDRLVIAGRAHGEGRDVSEVRPARISLAPARLFEPRPSRLAGPDWVAEAVDFARRLLELGKDAHLIGAPFCNVPEDLRPRLYNAPQRAGHPRYYNAQSAGLAERLYRRGRTWGAQAVENLLRQEELWANPIDRKLLPWLTEHPWARARVWALHKLTRRLRIGGRPEPVDPADEPAGVAPEGPMRPPCRTCRYRRVCDRYPDRLEAVLPGLELKPVEGALVRRPLELAGTLSHALDDVDRKTWDVVCPPEDLALEANRTLAERPPDRETSPFDYGGADGAYCDQVHGGVRWFGFTPAEKLSTPVAELTPPFLVSATFGGGMAEYIGFAAGPDARILTPMVATSHRLALYAAEDGRYVLLRDGRPTPPLRFPRGVHAPARLGGRIRLQLALVNIDGELVTQGVRIWELGGEREERVSPRCSVVIVCARYARRLEACLNGLAHQQGVEPGEVEVMLAYVPGIDATEDVIDSFQAAHPELRILRAPFAAAYASSKGKLINETVANAMGDWVVLLDADIVLPSDALARLGELPAETAFAAPAGRKMLGREDTARVLLGELRPWEDWDSVMAGPGEVRGDEGRGAPIGYMQCVRRPCFETVRYDEYGHFEGADWQFGEDMRRQYGEAARLDGLIVAHLDHGGSHWYGADKHR